MLRILTTILALVTLILAIVTFIKVVNGRDTMQRVITFFLLVISIIISFFIAMDVYMTVQLFFEYYLGEMGIIEPPVYPGSAKIWGIWENEPWYLFLLSGLCIATLLGILKRNKIPALLAGNRYNKKAYPGVQ